MLRKRLKALAIAALCAIGMPAAAVASGTTPLSLVQQFDSSGKPLANCQLYFFAAGTVTTPQNAYADFGLTTALPNPLSCDQSGRVPQHWLADGLIHIRLTDSSGIQQIDTTMQVLGPSSGGGGGGGTVDPTTLMQTGDVKVRYGTGTVSGFVRANGLTIGNATSGATERANADTQNLFVYLYTADANLTVSGGRTGNALNDYNAGKQLTLPDYRGRALAGLDDMGNSAAGILTATYFGTSATVLGAKGGSQNHTQTIAEMASHSHSVFLSDPGHVHGFQGYSQFGGLLTGTGNSGVYSNQTTNTAFTGITINDGSGHNNQTAAVGSGTPFAVVSPEVLATVYIRL